jgi:hypothetical protein
MRLELTQNTELSRVAMSWTVGIDSRHRLVLFSSLPRPYRLWEPPGLFIILYREFFSRGKAAGAWVWPLIHLYSQVYEAWSFTFLHDFVTIRTFHHY